MSDNKTKQKNNAEQPNTAEKAAQAAEKNGEANVVNFPTQEVTGKKDEQPKAAEPKVLTLQELKEKAVSLYYLQEKHGELTEQRQKFKEFAITSDKQKHQENYLTLLVQSARRQYLQCLRCKAQQVGATSLLELRGLSLCSNRAKLPPLLQVCEILPNRLFSARCLPPYQIFQRKAQRLPLFSPHL